MKKAIFILFLMFCFSIRAQHNYPFFKAQDTLNTFLSQNPTAYYITNNGQNKKIKKIKANINGTLRILDSHNEEIDSSEGKSSKNTEVLIDLFQFEKALIYPSSIRLMDKNNKVYGTIYEMKRGDKINFTKQLNYLKQYCLQNKAKDYIKSYYANFKTGYNFDGKYIALSDNYKVEINESLLIFTFDLFTNNIKSKSETVSFDLKDIIAIEPNGTDVVEILDSETITLPICGKLLFKNTKEDYNINIYYEVDEDVTETEIYKAFEEVINSFQK